MFSDVSRWASVVERVLDGTDNIDGIFCLEHMAVRVEIRGSAIQPHSCCRCGHSVIRQSGRAGAVEHFVIQSGRRHCSIRVNMYRESLLW